MYKFLFLLLYKMEVAWLPVTFWYQIWSERVEYVINIPRYVIWAICIRTIICLWKMFKKAWLPGWGAIVPFYNIYLRFKMASMWGWWVLSLLFPPLFVIALIISFFELPGRFGKLWARGFGLWFLNPIFIGIFAFDKSTYTSK